MAGAGILIGLLAAFAASRYVESQLYGMKASDPAVFAIGAAPARAGGGAAALVPGWRASKIEPVVALKYE